MIVGHDTDNGIEFSPVVHQFSDGFLIAVESHRLHGCLVEDERILISGEIFGEVSPLDDVQVEDIHKIVIHSNDLIIFPFGGIFAGSPDSAVIPYDLPSGHFRDYAEFLDLGLPEQLLLKGGDGFSECLISDPGNADHHGLFHVKAQILIFHVNDLSVNGKRGRYQHQSDNKLEDNQDFSEVHSFRFAA